MSRVDRFTGRLVSIWIKRGKLAPMDQVECVRVVAGKGLEGNANQGGKRQITLLSKEAWELAVGELGVDLDPARRRANLLVGGLDLKASAGRILEIGSIQIQVYGETRPCELMDREHEGLQAVLRPEWRGGVFGEPLDSGSIRVGDPIRWVS